MAKGTKIQDFRKLNIETKETTPAKKKSKGSVSMSKKRNKKLNLLLPFLLIILILIGVCLGCMLTPTFNISIIEVQPGITLIKRKLYLKFHMLKV